jgi:chromate transporter
MSTIPSQNEELAAAAEPARGNHLQIFLIFLRLGLTSFGGPIAHLGYFRQEFVERRKWLSEATFADLLALCNFLPGPTSSQVCYSIGMMRGGIRGALVAGLRLHSLCDHHVVSCLWHSLG